MPIGPVGSGQTPWYTAENANTHDITNLDQIHVHSSNAPTFSSLNAGITSCTKKGAQSDTSGFIDILTAGASPPGANVDLFTMTWNRVYTPNGPFLFLQQGYCISGLLPLTFYFYGTQTFGLD